MFRLVILKKKSSMKKTRKSQIKKLQMKRLLFLSASIYLCMGLTKVSAIESKDFDNYFNIANDYDDHTTYQRLGNF